jgi:hypothetical protein
MFRITPQPLLWTLENLGEVKIVNQISVDEQTRHYAKAALDRMLSLHERLRSSESGTDGAFMDDHDEDQDELSEPPQRIFTLTEAERTRRELEPFLIEAIGARKKLSVLEQDLTAVSTRILMMGGVLVPYAKLAEKRLEHQSLADVMKANLEKILSTGCLVKDLDIGLLDFPAIVNNEEVYLCWKLGEDRIRYYHRQDEGYAGRKPLDPRDLGPGEKLQ